MITCARIDEAALSRFSSMLVYLNLSSNLLEGELPRAFTVLQCLQALDLSRNNLADVKALTGLKSLKRLDLAHNKISRWDQLQALHESGLDLLTLRLEGNPVCSTLTGEKGEEQYSLLVKSLFPNIERIDDPESVGNHQHRFFGAAGHSGLGGGGRRGSDSAISVTSSSARTVYPSPPSPMLVDGGSDSSMFSDIVTRRSSLSATASLHAARAAISAAATTRSAGSSRAATPAFDAASNSDIKTAAKSVHAETLLEQTSLNDEEGRGGNINLNGHDLNRDHKNDALNEDEMEEEKEEKQEEEEEEGEEEEEKEEKEEKEEDNAEEEEEEEEEEDDDDDDDDDDGFEVEDRLTTDHLSKPPLPPPFIRTLNRDNRDNNLVVEAEPYGVVNKESTPLTALFASPQAPVSVNAAAALTNEADLQLLSLVKGLPLPPVITSLPPPPPPLPYTQYSHPSTSSHLTTPARPPSLSALQSSSAPTSSSSSTAPYNAQPPVTMSSLGTPQSTPGRGSSVFETKTAYTPLLHTQTEAHHQQYPQQEHHHRLLSNDILPSTVSEMALMPSSKLLSMLKSAEQRLAAQDEVLAEYEATLSSAYQLQQHDSAKNSAENRDEATDIDDDLDDASVQAMAYTRTLTSLRRDLIASRHSETNLLREATETRAQERNLQLQYDALKEEVEAIKKDAVHKEHRMAAALEIQQQQSRESEDRLRSQFRENEDRLREQISTLQQRSQQQYATYQAAMRKAENVAEESRIEVLKEMEELRSRQAQDLKEQQRRCSSLVADADARAALVGRTLSASLSDASMLRTELLEAQTRLTSETIARETAEAALADTKAALSSAYQSESYGRQQARKALEGKSLLGGLSQEVARTLSHCSNQADALERTVRDALSQLSARTAVVAGMLQGLKLSRQADAAMVNALVDGINEERNVWTESLLKQAERWHTSQAAKADYKTALAKLKAFKAANRQSGSVRGGVLTENEEEEEEEGEEEEDVRGLPAASLSLSASSFSSSTSLAALEVHTREKKRLMELLSSEHEEEIQSEAKLLSSTCAYTDFVSEQLLSSTSSSSSSVTDGSGSLTSSATTFDPTLSSLLSQELLISQLDTARQELSLLRPRLDAVLSLLEKGEGVEKSRAMALLLKLDHTERRLEQQRSEFNDASALAARELQNEKEASVLALEKAEAARVRQVSAARDASLRSRSQSANLEARLQSTLDELKAVKDECKRLEKEAQAAVKRSAMEQKEQINVFGDRLAAAVKESEDAKRTREEVEVLRREREVLLAALTKK